MITRWRIKGFWKTQRNGAATKLPERTVAAKTQEYAAVDYIVAFYPWVRPSDLPLVMQHTEPVQSEPEPEARPC